MHASFLTGLKGINSPIIDADFFESNYQLFVLVGELDSRITAFAVEKSDEKGTRLKQVT